VHLLEKGIGKCDPTCCEPLCDSDTGRVCAYTEWDEAVAHYVGSEPMAGLDDGRFSWSLAENICEYFGGCAETSQGHSKINEAIFRELVKGAGFLGKGECDNADQVKHEIIRYIKIPLIQSLLHVSYELSVEKRYTEKRKTRASVFAAAVLPWVHACNGADAEIIYQQLKIGAPDNVDFTLIKQSLERNYDCMEVKCVEVGGLVADLDGDGSSVSLYLPGAETCDPNFLAVLNKKPSEETTSSKTEPISKLPSDIGSSTTPTRTSTPPNEEDEDVLQNVDILLVFISVVMVASAITFIMVKCSPPRNEKEFDGMAAEFAEEDEQDNVGIPTPPPKVMENLASPALDMLSETSV